jgi:hypothetical protein
VHAEIHRSESVDGCASCARPGPTRDQRTGAQRSNPAEETEQVAPGTEDTAKPG